MCFILLSSVSFASVDEPSSWAEEAIDDLRTYQVFNEETFEDYQENITRADFIYLAVRIFEVIDGREIEIDSSIHFEDTSDSYALKGATVGITNGIGNDRFGPDQFLSREELATFMIRTLTLLNVNQSSSSYEKFDDHDLISDWAIESIYSARNQGIISGVGDNKVNPKGGASREMALVIANRILKTHLSDGESNVSDKELLGRYLLDESTSIPIWTDYPSENIFKEDDLPTDKVSGIDLYIAKNEFEPFQLALNPSKDTAISFKKPVMPKGLDIELHQVEYVYLDESTDHMGRTGWYPDPLYPKEFGQNISISGSENNVFWLTVKSEKDVAAGDYRVDLQVNDVVVPIRIYVFDFSVPEELHVKSQINLSTKNILDKYGVNGTGAEYWQYVDYVKQFMIDHRLTPKSALWSGGLTGRGGSPYIDYDSASGILSDPHGIWGFEYPALRYIDGEVSNLNKYLSNAFNGSVGFPSFMAMTFQNNDSSKDQRPDSFEGVSRTDADWYLTGNIESPYNKKWFKYISDLEQYLIETGYIDEAYYYMANEPQNQEDYDAVAWYSSVLKKFAPNLKLMVSEEAKPEIFDNPKYPGVKVDIWLPVLNNYNPEVSWRRKSENNEESWIYFLYGTKPPYFNPITLDHDSIEQKLTGWFLWKYRIEGIAHYSFNNWSNNVWQDQMTSGHNGDNFMLYPPGKDNSPIAYGATNHRLVSSIRFELMRDSLEDYEYLYRLNHSNEPIVYEKNTSDNEVDKIIYGLTSYNRDSHFMYSLRKNIGLKISGVIDEIPDIETSASHERADELTAYYLNFTESTSGLTNYNGKDYMSIGWDVYDADKGYGWYGDMSHVMSQHMSQESNPLKASILYDDWGREKVFEFDLANGIYDVTVGCGWYGRTYNHNFIDVEGTIFINDEATSPYIERTKRIEVKDQKLTMTMGIFNEYTMLNYMEVVPVE